MDQICTCTSVINLSFSQIWHPCPNLNPKCPFFFINIGYFCFKRENFYLKKILGAAEKKIANLFSWLLIKKVIYQNVSKIYL